MCALGSEQVPSTDAEYKEAIHKLYAEPGPRHMSPDDVDKLLEKHADDLSKAFMTALYVVRGRSRQCVTKKQFPYTSSSHVPVALQQRLILQYANILYIFPQFYLVCV